jgi:HK97 family phage major capsid protein
MPFAPALTDAPDATEVRSHLMAAGDYLRDLRCKSADDRGDGYDTDVRSAVTFIKDWDPVLSAWERGAAPELRKGPEAALFGDERGRDRRSVGEIVIGDEKYGEFAKSGQSGARFHELEVRGSLLDREARALLDSTGGAANFIPVGQPIPPRVRERRLFVRDLVSVQDTGLDSVPYIRESHASETGAAKTAEGGAKSEVSMNWTPDDAPVRKITAWIPATTEIIDDAPTLQGYINNRLAYLLAVREEDNLLNGNGTSPNLKGVTQFAGVQSQAFTTDILITLGLAMGKIENVDGEPDGVAINPTDFWAAITSRHADSFDGAGSVTPLPFGAAPSTLWGVPAVRTTSVAAGGAILGCWRMGATLFDRQRTTIRVGNQHSDFFTTNKVAILCEERVALAVHRPDYFVLVDTSAV